MGLVLYCKRLCLRRTDFADNRSVFVEKSESAIYVFFGVELDSIRSRAVCGIEVCRHARGNSAVVLRCRVEGCADFGNFVEFAEVGQAHAVFLVRFVGLIVRGLAGMRKVVHIGIDVGCKRNHDVVRYAAQSLVEAVNEIAVKEVLDD